MMPPNKETWLASIEAELEKPEPSPMIILTALGFWYQYMLEVPRIDFMYGWLSTLIYHNFQTDDPVKTIKKAQNQLRKEKSERIIS